MLVWLFPGQGSQAVGMGQSWYQASPAARRVFERADHALGWSVSRLCFEGPEEELGLTERTQPAVLTVSMAIVAALREAYPGVCPAYAAGHSLGEYSALVAAGAIELEDALRIVSARGRAMQQAVPAGTGGMVAIMGAGPEQVLALCEQAAQGEVLEPANYNAPGQVVVAGQRGALERLVELAPAWHLKTRWLKVSAPFHCRLMRPAAEVVAKALGSVQIARPAFPVVFNATARENSDPELVAQLLVEQVTAPVEWERSVRRLVELGATHALELGPGQVLVGLVRRIEKKLWVRGLGGPDELGDLGRLLEEAA